MVRYLILLECFLIALLAAHWLGGGALGLGPRAPGPVAAAPSPDNGPPAHEAAPATADEGGARPTAGLSDQDRSTLASQLLGPSGRAADAVPPDAPADAAGAPVAPAADAALPLAEPATKSPPTERADADEPPSPAATAKVATAQRLLARLGYDPGPADGVLGDRTRRALQEYVRRTGAAPDAAISDALLTKMRTHADRLAARRPRTETAAARSAPGGDRPPGWVASIAGGFQRLLGHEFDSRKNPGRIREYCRNNPDNWIFDEGRGSFVYCAQPFASR